MSIRRRDLRIGLLAAGAVLAIGLAGCAETPVGPTVAVWPAPGKPFAVFQADEAACRQYAAGDADTRAANNSAAARTAVGTVVGAAAGALIGDSSGAAGVGAGIGLLAGSAAGAQASERGTWSAQRRYNIAYEQCMYAKGNQVPGAPRSYYAPLPPPPGGG